MSKKTSEVEEMLDNISVTIISPDGDEAYMDSITGIQEYKQLTKAILDWHTQQLAKEKMELVEEAVKLFAEHLLTLKDGTHDIRAEARRFVKSFSALKSEEKEEENE